MKKIAFVFLMAACLTLGLVGCGGGSVSLTWTGLDNVEVVKGDDFDVMSGVKVTDSKLGDVTDKVVVLTEENGEADLTELGVWEDFRDFNHNLAGVYTVYYKIESSGITEIKSREITVTSAHNLGNGDFAMTNAEGFYDWQTDAPGGSMKLEKFTDTDGRVKPKFSITDPGNGWWSLQFINSVSLKQGESYKITIRAKSETGKAVAFGFEDPDNNYAMLQGLTVHKLTNEYKTYETYYTADKNYINAKAVLYLGRQLPTDRGEHSVVLDRINVEKIEKCENVTFTGLDNVNLISGEYTFDPKAGVTAKQGETDLTDRIEVIGALPVSVTENANHALAYVIRNENGPTAFAIRRVGVSLKVSHEVQNGDFTEGFDYWTKDVNAQNPGKATFETTAEGAKITIEEPSSADWHIQLHQIVTFENAKNYLIRVRAKASVNRAVQLELRAATKFPMALTTEFKDFEFAYNSKEKGGAKVSFLMGGGGSANKGSVITIASVEIVLDEDQTQYENWQFVNPSFEFGMKNWVYEGKDVTFTENQDGSVTANLAAQESNDAWRVQLRQDGLTVAKDQTYKITVRVKASAARQIVVEAYNGDRKALNASHTFDITTEEAEYTFEYTASGNASDVRAGMLLGGSNIAGTTVTVYHFEITKVTAEA